MMLDRPTLRLLVAALALACPASGLADDHGRDQERARRAVREGYIRPLSEILARVQEKVPGRVVEIELKQRGAGSIYELKIVTSGGRLIEAKVDAATGQLLGIED